MYPFFGRVGPGAVRTAGGRCAARRVRGWCRHRYLRWRVPEVPGGAWPGQRCRHVLRSRRARRAARSLRRR